MAAAAGPSGGTQPKRKLGALELQAKLRDSIYSKRFSFQVGNKYLEDALTLVGIPMRSDSSLLNGDLDKRYEEVNSLVKLKVDRLDASGDSAMGVTDGWKNKHVELGASLVDFSSLLPDGGRIFHDVKDVSELKKDAEGIKTLLQAWPQQLRDAGQHVPQITGWVMDNTAANKRAMNKLEEADPSMVNVGCAGK
ncbi:hypothetical protein V8C86DRAFT_3117001 [Haematococcus lacustris]